MARKSRRRTNTEAKKAQPRHAQSRNPQTRPAGNERTERTGAALQEAAGQANPYEPMARLVQAFMPITWFRPWVAAVAAPAPKLDVIDREGSVLVRAEVPGVQKGQLAVEASDVAVTIKGEIAHEETREGESYSIAEMSHGMFERTVQMPAEVDSARAKATFKDGVVEVLLPKVDRSRAHPVRF